MGKKTTLTRFNPLATMPLHTVVRVEGDIETALGYYLVDERGAFGALASAFVPGHEECRSCIRDEDVEWLLVKVALYGVSATSVHEVHGQEHSVTLDGFRGHFFNDRKDAEEYIVLNVSAREDIEAEVKAEVLGPRECPGCYEEGDDCGCWDCTDCGLLNPQGDPCQNGCPDPTFN
jgi:hypothetical protein